MTINEIRAQIDNIDDQIVELLFKRLDLCKIIGDIKVEKKLPVFNQLREEEILNRLSSQKSDYSRYIKPLFTEIFKISKDVQSRNDN